MKYVSFLVMFGGARGAHCCFVWHYCTNRSDPVGNMIFHADVMMIISKTHGALP